MYMGRYSYSSSLKHGLFDLKILQKKSSHHFGPIDFDITTVIFSLIK